MQTIDQEKYDYWKGQQSDGYGQAIFAYAERWADLMEKAISEGKQIKDVAKDTSHEADTSGITGYMYGAAVSTLAQCWVHGEELRQWHNIDAQIGTEGEEANKKGGTLNPALLNISTK